MMWECKEVKLTILEDIYEEISHYKTENISLISGYVGIVLFYERYSKITDICSSDLERSIEQLINLSYNVTDISYSNGLSGVGWLFDYLIKSDVIDVDDSFFVDIDYRVKCSITDFFDSNNFDFLHGLIGIGSYLLARKQHEIINSIVNHLFDKSIKTKQGFSWKSFIYDENKKIDVYELSLSHGNSAIVSFLCKCVSQKQNYSNKALIILRKSVNYILNNRIDNKTSLFPSYIFIDNPNEIQSSRLAWCNGDLGISVALWNAGVILNDRNLMIKAESICLATTRRKQQEETSIIDAGICHGSAGVAQVYYRMYKNTKNKVFKESYEFWIKETTKFRKFNDGVSGYKSWGGINGFYNDFGLLGGVTGVGTVLASSIIQDTASWDTAFLIS